MGSFKLIGLPHLLNMTVAFFPTAREPNLCVSKSTVHQCCLQTSIQDKAELEDTFMLEQFHLLRPQLVIFTTSYYVIKNLPL